MLSKKLNSNMAAELKISFRRYLAFELNIFNYQSHCGGKRLSLA